MKIAVQEQKAHNRSILNELYTRDKSFPAANEIAKEKRKSTRRQGVCLVAWSSFLAGILLGGIALAVILTIYLREEQTMVTKSTISKPTMRWNPVGITVAGRGSGSRTSNPLSGPYGFVWDSSGALCIAELGGHRVTKWIPGAANGTVIAGLSNGTFGNTSNTLRSPVDVLIEQNGAMYITDRANNRLQYYPSGSWSAITRAGIGSSTNIVLNGPSALARNPENNDLYISNWYIHQIISFPSGNIVAGGNGRGNRSTQLDGPIGFAYDEVSKSFIISNYDGHTVVRWNLGASSWTSITGIPRVPGNSTSRVNGPLGVAIDPMGNIYVADSNNHRVLLFMDGQTVGTTIAGVNGVSGTQSDRLNEPYWVKLDNQLNLYVADKNNGRIQKFERVRS